MHLLVTRPENDAGELIDQLEAQGCQVSHFPLLEINFHKAVDFPAQLPQAVLITSANGARALAKHARILQLADTLAISVGASSAAAAKEAGFKNIVRTASGDVTGVIDYVRENLKPEAGSLLYASGSKTSGDLVGQLQTSGFVVDRVVLYRADPASELPEAIGEAVRKKNLDGVLLYSPRTAKIWLSLAIGQTGACHGASDLANIKHYCLSENVAKIIDQGLGKFSDTIICKEPDTPSMLQAVRREFRRAQ